MRVALTGTPGTGKTTVSELVETDLEVVHLNSVVREAGLTESVDEDRDSLVVDMAAVRAWLEGREDVLVESHLAHRFAADRVVVLRCHPDELAERLHERGEGGKARENAEHGEDRVYEVDTTGREPEAVVRDVEAAIAGARPPSAGGVDFTGWLG
jgi:adenylate kinase